MLHRKVKDLPKDERPRERLLAHGAGVLADAEVLAVLLGSGSAGQSAIELARQLLQNGWDGMGRMTPDELRHIRGMGPAKAAILSAALEMGRRMRENSAGRTIHGPNDALALLGGMQWLDQEEFRVIFLNTKHRVQAIETIFKGGLDSVDVYPREIFRRAVARSSAALIVAHNHPSGDPEPSSQDRGLTRRLEQAGMLMGIPILDHLIVGQARSVSLHQDAVTELK